MTYSHNVLHRADSDREAEDRWVNVYEYPWYLSMGFGTWYTRGCIKQGVFD